LRLAAVEHRDARIVERDRVAWFAFHRTLIARARFVELSALVQHEAALIPQLGAVGYPLDQRFVCFSRRGQLATQQMYFLDRLLQSLQSDIQHPAIVGYFAQIKMDQGAARVRVHRALEPYLRDLDVTDLLLGETDLDQRVDVCRVEAEQLSEFCDRFLGPS